MKIDNFGERHLGYVDISAKFRAVESPHHSTHATSIHIMQIEQFSYMTNVTRRRVNTRAKYIHEAEARARYLLPFSPPCLLQPQPSCRNKRGMREWCDLICANAVKPDAEKPVKTVVYPQ